jgi:N-acetylglutamate synthase-like GNAT family acetyltransferase
MDYEQIMEMIEELEAQIDAAEKDKEDHEKRENQFVVAYVEGKITGLLAAITVMLMGAIPAAVRDARKVN